MTGFDGAVTDPSTLRIDCATEVDARSGNAVVSVPLRLSPGRNGFGPQLALGYDSSAPNTAFGLGWTLHGLLAVSVATRRHLPRYDDTDDYAFSATGELVPALREIGGSWRPEVRDAGAFWVHRYRPRMEQGFLRIERWTEKATRRVHWRTRDAHDTLTVLGLDASGLSRVADPDDESRVVSWLPDAQYDAFGNAILYKYLAEDATGVDLTQACERGRSPRAQRHLKRIRYGNTRPVTFGSAVPAQNRWAFEIVLDYGDHGDTAGAPDAAPSLPWLARPDAFSSYRAGFDVRNHRLCRRVLQLHRFPDLGADPVVVGAYTLDHALEPTGSTLRGISYTGYRHENGATSARQIPSLTLTYSEPAPAEGFVEVAAQTLVGAPVGLDGPHRWVDLYGDGLPGLLTESGSSWYYKANLGGGLLDFPRPLTAHPSCSLADVVINDVDADGDTDVAVLHGRDAGYFRFDRDADRWQPFRPFARLPHQEGAGTVAQWIDLDGDGRSDLLVASPERVVWYANRGRDGFSGPFEQPRLEPSSRAPLTQDPDLDYFFADMTGDGLVDQVRVRNGRVEYWPNLGHGRFGAPVVMDGAPTFTADWAFDARRVRLVDLDGTGGADVIYLGEGEVDYWFNANGNRLVAGPRLRGLPRIDSVSSLNIVDFTGDGSPSLVWSSPLVGSTSALQYLPLNGGVRPRLLLAVENGAGLRTELEYASSASHQLRDQRAGRPWRTRLPAHHHVVEQRTVIDQISGTRLTSRNAYHDGAFDSDERQFAGFGTVDQYDTEEAGAGPVGSCLRTWFHQGRALRGAPPGCYASAPVLDAARFEAVGGGVDDPTHAQGLRAARGTALRTEVFAVGADGRFADHPFTVTQRGVRLRRLQPATPRHDAVFLSYVAETLISTYEGEPDDARTAHDIVLSVDEYGATTATCSVAYPRNPTVPAATPAQTTLSAMARKHDVAHVVADDRHVLAVPVAQRDLEVHGLTIAPGAVLDRDLLANVLLPVLNAPLLLHETPTPGSLEARLVGISRVRYWNDALTAPLPVGTIGALALVHHDETAVFTPAWAAATYGAKVDAGLLAGDGGYFLDDGHWWKPGETKLYAPPSAFSGLVGTERAGTRVATFTFDDDALALVAVADGVGNLTLAEHDHQALAVARVTDPNDNFSEVRYDALRVPVLRSRQGQVLDAGGTPRPAGDDRLSAYAPVAAATPATAIVDPAGHLQGASEAVFYDLAAWTKHGRPPSAVVLRREEHVHDGLGGAPAAGRPAVSVSHTDGFGNVLQAKQLVGPGPAVRRDGAGHLVLGPDGTTTTAPADPRWLASGHVVLNRKGQVVQEYEPFHTGTPDYEGEQELAHFGVARTTRYDAVGRPVREDLPNGTYRRREHRPWAVVTHDPNDTVQHSDYRVLREALPATDPERLALTQAQAHAGTPTTTHLDVHGREVRTVQLAAVGDERATETVHDARGLVVAITDERGLETTTFAHDMLGRAVHTTSVDAGDTWTLLDAGDRPAHVWNARGVHLSRRYDAADRLVQVRVSGALGLDQVVEELVYGDDPSVGQAALRNLRGQVAVHRDQTGVVTVDAYDLQAQPLRTSRQVREDYVHEPDWDDPSTVVLEPEQYQASARYDALGRPTRMSLPDGSTQRLAYERGGGLSSLRISSDDGKLADVVLLQRANFGARGQLLSSELGNGVTITREQDPATFRTSRITARAGPAAPLQDLRYTYDPAGNVVLSVDLAQRPAAPVPFVQGLNVVPDAEYTYDALYQLVRATGRVHQALLEHDYRPGAPGTFKGTRHLALNNGAAVERYTRDYEYDAAGNLSRVRHTGATQSWTTDFWVSSTSNRSLPARDPSGTVVADPEARFDAAGNLAALPHLRALDWSYRNAIARAVTIDRGGSGQPDDADHYVYDATGRRTRVVAERLLGTGAVEVTDTLYFDGCEIKRVRRGAAVRLERATTHVDSGFGRLALVHRWTTDTAQVETSDVTRARVRYQLVDHLGSATLELDEAGGVIAYEEYFPFGGTAFIAGDQARDVAVKDYRFCGRQRDDATGLYHIGHRYYASWLSRWLSPDPSGPGDDHNLYRYVRNDPVNLVDPDGLQATTPPQRRGQVTTVRGPVPQQVNAAWAALTPERRAELQRTGFSWVLNNQGVQFYDRATAQRLEQEMLARGENVARLQVARPARARPPKVSPDGSEIAFEDDAIIQNPAHATTDPNAVTPGRRRRSTTPPRDGGGGRGSIRGNGGGRDDRTTPGGQQGNDGTGGGARGAGGQQPGSTGTGNSNDPGATGVHDASGASGATTPANPLTGNGGTGGDGPGLGQAGNGTGGGGTQDGGTPGGRGDTGSASGTGTGQTGNGTGADPNGTGAARRPGTGAGGTGGRGTANGGQPGGTGDRPGGSPGGRTGQPGSGGGGDSNLPPGNGLTPPPPGQTVNGNAPNGSPNGSLTGSANGSDAARGQRTGGAGAGHGTNPQATPPGQTAPGGSGGRTPPQERTFGDRVIKYFGYLNLEFGDDGANGQSGGIPGGHGTHNWGGWGQALYALVSVVGVVLMFLGGGGIKAAFAGLKAGLAAAGRALLRVFTKEFWQVAGSRVAGWLARDAAALGRRKFTEWLWWLGDKGGTTKITGNIGSKWWPRFTTTVTNFEKAGTWAFRDTAAHEGFHAWLARHAGIVWKAGDATLFRIPVGAPVKWAEEVVAYAIGHANALRLHVIPLAPLEAFGSMRLGERAFTLATFAGLGGYAWWRSSEPAPTPAPAQGR